MARDFPLGTSSATELLVESESLRSFFGVRRDVKKMILVAAAVLAVVVFCVIIGVAWRPRTAGQQDSATENAIMVRLAVADIDFARGNCSAPSGAPGSPLSSARAAQNVDALHRGRGGNRTRRQDGDYRELDKM